MVLATPDNFLHIEIDETAYRQLYFYTAGMFTLVTQVIALQIPDPDYTPVFIELTKELLGDQYGHSFRNNQDLIDLLKRPEPIDVDSEVEINFSALPDQPGEIRYDKALHKVQGAVHGLVHFLTPPKSTFYSPGQVLDLKQFFEYCSLDRSLIGPPELRKAFDELYQFFASAALRGDGVMQISDFFEDI